MMHRSPAAGKTKRRMTMEPRRCECCGSGDLEALWEYGYTARTRSSAWEFDVRNVICARCGFIFVAPVPTKSCLHEYYADAWALYEKQPPHYDIDKRIRYLEGLRQAGGVFIEIGSNRRTAFHDRLGRLFSRIITAEPNNAVASDVRSIADIENGTADVIAHYFVLEHVPDAVAFLSRCHEVLKPEGVMVCEVPDVRLYGDDISGLIYHEHVNHFSVDTLARIAGRAGFMLAGSSAELCSRPFGFAAAFRKAAAGTCPVTPGGADDYLRNKDAFLRGVRKASQFAQSLGDAYRRLDDHVRAGRKAVLWAANDNLLGFLGGGRVLPRNTVIVDSNPLKKDYCDAYPVLQPGEARGHILESDLLYIFSRMNSGAIQAFLASEYGKSFDPGNVVVLDV